MALMGDLLSAVDRPFAFATSPANCLGSTLPYAGPAQLSPEVRIVDGLFRALLW